MSKVIIKPTITIHHQEYDLYSLIIHRVLIARFRDLLLMQDTILHSLSIPLNQTVNGSVIMTLKSQNSSLTKKSPNSWITVSQTLLIYFSFSENTILMRSRNNSWNQLFWENLWRNTCKETFFSNKNQSRKNCYQSITQLTSLRFSKKTMKMKETVITNPSSITTFYDLLTKLFL